MKVTAILFDVGDTLHDLTNYTSIARKILIEKLVDQGVPIVDVNKSQKLFEEIIRRHAKPHTDRFFLEVDFFEKLFEEMDAKVDARLLNFALVIYRGILRSFITPSAVVISTLSTLKGKAYKLGVVTDGSIDSTYEILMRLGITEFFDVIVVSEEVGIEKPNPKIFQEALIRLNARPSETMIVGDSLERDIKGGKQLGMVTVLIQRYQLRKNRETKVEPDYRIQRFDELLEILAQV